jgi:O-antigen/teichoic acid export membrane protein
MSRKLLKDSSIYGLGQILNRSFGFVLIPVYTRYLTVEEYGSLALLNMLLQVISFVCLLGISQAAMRFYFDGNADDRYRQQVYGTATAMLIALPAMAMVVAGPIILFMARQFLPSIPYEYVLIVLAIGLFTPLDKLMSGLLRIQRRAPAYVVFNAGFFLFQTLAILAAVAWLNYGLAGQLWAQLLANAVASLAAFLVLRRYSQPTLVRPLAMRMLRFGVPLIPFFILTWVGNAAGRFAIEGFGTLAEVGLFALAAQFAGLLYLVSTAADSALMPHFLERAGRAGTEDELGILITRYLTVIGVVGIGVIAMSGPLIGLVSAAAYHDAAAYVTPLVFANWLLAAGRPVIWCFNHTGRTGTLSIIQIGALGLLIGLLFLCLGPLTLGINGVAVAMIGANLSFLVAGWAVAGLGYRPRINWRHFGSTFAVLLAAGTCLGQLAGTAKPTPLAAVTSLVIFILVVVVVARMAGVRRWRSLFRI